MRSPSEGIFTPREGTKEADRLPRLAATTVLLRPGSTGGFEVFFVKRHGKIEFMGGAHVFPGGKVDACDGDEAWLERFTVPGIHQEGAQGNDVAAFLARLEPTPGRSLAPPDVTGSVVAAARELFEEAGVLLAVDAGGVPVVLDDTLRAARGEVHDDPATFGLLLDTHGVRLDLSALCYFAHWVTPSLERRRFDARFFLARLPHGQDARIDQTESVEGVWHTPREALAAAGRGEMVLPPPTLRTVEWLAQHASIDAAFAAAAQATVAPILPKVLKTEHGVAILLPWDAEYPSTPGASLEGLSGPNHPSAFGSGRIVLRDGRWQSL